MAPLFISPVALPRNARPLQPTPTRRRPPLHRLCSHPLCTHLAPHNLSTDHHLQLPNQSPTAVPHSTAPPRSASAEESLILLDWPAISAQIARHASTPLPTHYFHPAVGIPIPTNREESERLLQLTRALHYMYFTLLKPIDFHGISSVATLVNQAAKGVLLTGAQLRQIADTLSAARRIRRAIDAIDDDRLQILQQLVSDLRTYPHIDSRINALIDDFGQVVHTFDPPLRRIRADIRTTTSEITAHLNQLMSKHADAMQERVLTMRYDRFVIPVKTQRKGMFKRAIVHDLSASGVTTYMEPASVRRLNDRLRQLAAQERARVNQVLKELCQLVAPIQHDITTLCHVIMQLDIAAAKASASHQLDAVDVQFDDHRPLHLLGVRHPLLSWQEMTQDHHQSEPQPSDDDLAINGPRWKEKVVPTSYILPDDVRCVCVTGPNTGGKTLALKTLGVTVLLAKIGMFVPGTTQTAIDGDDHSSIATIPYFDSVLADIGDDQSLVQSLSTFSGHVQRIKRILASTTPSSLVLLDEIGSGTDPAEGAALGMSILRHLAIGNRAALTFATTHHGELKTLKYSKDESARFFENASVEFDDVNMVPTYRLVWGIPGRSNALAIAERLGLDTSVIEEARFLLSGTGDDTNDTSARVDIEKMISSLERDKSAAEAARADSERALRQATLMRSELEDRLRRLRENESQLRKDQKSAVEGEVKEAKKQIAKVIREMQRGGGSAQAAGRAADRLGKMKIPDSATSSQAEVVPSKPVSFEDIEVGDKVSVPRLSSNEVEVVEKPNKRELVVAMGGMRAKVKVKEVVSVNQRELEPAVRSVPDRASSVSRKQLKVKTAANTIDIRGQTVDSAESMVEQAIGKALAMGTLWVIHGHGTGRLRNGIRRFLSQHDLVERITDAEQEDGGTGVTIAFLH